MSSIDYDLKRIRAVAFDVDGVLSPSTIPTWPEALPLAVKCGLKICIITGAKSRGIEVRYGSLGITDIFSGAAQKLEVLTGWMERNSLTPEEVAFVGDDVPDYQPMKHVGLSVAPADAAADILAIARYISPVNGGYGVARDLLEQILRAQGHWMSQAKAFGW